ncbi:hypothetical protein B0H10DRAFT_1879054 [Mycena sp. CBHHK59/15]|nr:hypothetical protein B0H10DRAFT_1879054 [Mycena sp. CBHHK59/15]
MPETVIREVTENVWTFSRPFAIFGIRLGGRSTAIKLNNGGLWVLASTPLTTETKAKLDELGPVQYICGPNSVHYMYLGEFKKAYPSAKLIAPAAAIKRNPDKSLTHDGIWGTDAPETKYGFEDEIHACYFSGYKNRDVAFCHVASSTLIEADLLFNLPGTEQYSKSKSTGTFPFWGSIGKPVSWLSSKVAASMTYDMDAMKRDVKTVADWKFERVIPCHGDVIEKDGNQIWRDAYKSFLE